MWEPQKTGEKEAKDIQNQNPSLTKNKPDNSLRMIHTAVVGVCSDERGATDDEDYDGGEEWPLGAEHEVGESEEADVTV
jgi:hypothetical protein